MHLSTHVEGARILLVPWEGDGVELDPSQRRLSGWSNSRNDGMGKEFWMVETVTL
jgi:hypothetical protein